MPSARPERDSSRRPPGRPAIPADRFVGAALAIIDEHGVDAVTMRAVAQRLGSGTATLYRHFDNRAHLLAGVVDSVLSEATDAIAAAPRGDWIHELDLICNSTFDALRRHRNVMPLLAQKLPTGHHAIAGRDRIISVLLDGGCPPALAASAYATLARYVLGFAIQFSNNLGDSVIGPRGPTATVRDQARSDPTRQVSGTPLETEFAFGLDLLLAGLAQLIDPPPH